MSISNVANQLQHGQYVSFAAQEALKPFNDFFELESGSEQFLLAGLFIKIHELLKHFSELAVLHLVVRGADVFPQLIEFF